MMGKGESVDIEQQLTDAEVDANIPVAILNSSTESP